MEWMVNRLKRKVNDVNTIKLGAIAASAILRASVARSFAVEGQALQIQGTNLVLSWPSPGGYQQHLIQYRATLDPSTPWTELTNNYFANSSGRTTYTILGVVPQAQVGGGGGGETNDPPPGPMGAAIGEPTEPMAARVDGTGSIVPLMLYPPGFDLASFLIYDPGVSDWVKGSEYTRPDPSVMALDGPLSLNGPGGPNGPDPGGLPGSGFYRVFHIPDWSFNATNYTYDGPTFFPVDFADYLERVDDFKLLLNGQETEYAEFMPYVMGNGQTNWGMGIYFDRLPSASYTIQLLCTLRQNEAVGDDAIYLILSNQVRTITVNNQIIFTNWDDTIQADTYTFDARIANPNSDWWIDIYDARGNYVKTGSGHTSEGHIAWTWDLTDYLGTPRTDFDSDPFFYSETTFSTAGNGPATTRNNPTTADDYPNVGQWVTSFQDRWFSDAPGYPYDCQQTFTDAMGEIQGGPVLKGDPAWYAPIKFGTNVYSQAERELSWANLKSWLSSPWVRNWYYFGHGGGNKIGADRHTLDTNGLVTGSAFTYPGSKSSLGSWQMAIATRSFRYRFVFLDGCSTATGDWPNAFSISKTTRDLSFYQNDSKHRRPSAFVGWNLDTGGKGWGTIEHYYEFRSFWMGLWAVNTSYQLDQALKDANLFSGWIDTGKFDGAIRVYGYTVMQMEDYNHKYDWRKP
jgi:hypothetical protein